MILIYRGTIGELLIISIYGFPLESFPIITMIGTLVDAPATMLNAVGDNVASMVVARMLGGKSKLSTALLLAREPSLLLMNTE